MTFTPTIIKVNDSLTIAITKGSPAFKRAVDGYFAQLGACNPGALARTLVRMMDEDSTLHHAKFNADPGVRMVLHQLAYLTFGGCVDLDPTYTQDYNICRDAYEHRDEK